MSRRLLLVLVGVVALVCIGGLLAVRLDRGGHDPIDEDAFSAHLACAQFTRDRLRTPDSSRFPDYDAGGVSITHNGTMWTVSSFVDGRDPFGANQRLHFRCTLTDNGTSWHLDDWTETPS